MQFRDFSKLFKPYSVAIIGASRNNAKLGNIVLKNIIEFGFSGEVYPVNPHAESILGVKTYNSYTSIPVIPELAIISIPAKGVINSVREIALKGTKNIIIFSAGFREAGEEGRKLENELKAIKENFDLNIVGPNCLGLVSTHAKLNATFGESGKTNGNLRFISQSGAIATSVFDWANSTGIGFNEFITLGNKADITEVDILNYWLNTPLYLENRDDRLSNLNPIGIYTESIPDGKGFIKSIAQHSLKNPVLVLKPGKSHAAQKAMQSHTGSLAGSDKIFNEALKESGAIRCDGIEDFFNYVKAFSWEKIPQGPNVAIVSNAGGPAVMTSDFIEDAGLQLATINGATKARLSRTLPPSAGLDNPIDVLGDALADRYAEALDAVLGQIDVHAAIVILTPQIMTESYLTAQLISRLSKIHNKPILCSFMGGNQILEGEKILDQHKIPNFRFPEQAVKALGKMWEWNLWSINSKSTINNLNLSQFNSSKIETDIVNEILIEAKDKYTFIPGSSNIALDSFQMEKILTSAKINVPTSESVENFNDCTKFVKEHSFPVVLKIASNRFLHKTEIGGVKVGINNYNKLKKAYNELLESISKMNKADAESCKIQIQKQTDKGIEVILGIKKDPDYGHIMMFGAGGTLAELVEDTNLKMLPVNSVNAYQLVSKSKINKLLNGFRGGHKYELNELYLLMEKLSNLVLEFPEFEEIEINPIIITKDDVWAVDGKGIIS